MNVVIIGNGPAGYYCASRIRKNSDKAVITVIDQSSHSLYTRIRLPDYIAGKVEREKLFLANDSQYKDQNILLKREEKVVGIFPEAKEIETVKQRYSYDYLVITTGSRPFIPPIPGSSLPHVHTLRTLHDAENIKSFAKKGRNAVVIGGGLLGLESAHSLMHLDMDVVVVESFPQLLQQQLDKEKGDKVKTLLEETGMTVLLDKKTDQIDEKNVYLSSGEVLPADLVLINTGVRSCTELAEECGIKVNRGIVVDKTLQTSVPGIYAVGDCAEFESRVYGLWMAAKSQAEALADILTGKKDSYTPPEFRPMVKIPGIRMDQL